MTPEVAPASASALDAVSVEQRVTEFEEARESGIDGAAEAAQAFFAADTGSFDEILEAAPQAAADYLDEARGVVSTAHGPQTNMSASAMFSTGCQ